MKQEPLILTFDFGTQSVRASVYDKKGACLAIKQKTYEPAYFSPKPGYAEMDPNYYFECLCECSKALAKESPELLERVAGIEIDCFRDSAVLLDKDRNVIRPMILWLDTRMAKCEKKLPLIHRLLFKLVGMTDVIKMNARRTIANWIKENEPENFAKIDKYVSVSTYFVYRLTGELRDSPSNYTGHYPIEYKKKRFYKNPTTHMQGQIFSLRKDQLPELVETQGILGEISEEGAKATGLAKGIKIYAGGSDKSCETLGCGVVDSSMASVSLGTACSIETVTKDYISPIKLFPAYSSVQPGVFNMDVQIYRGFWMINWFLKEFGAWNIKDLVVEQNDPVEFNKRLNDIPPGSDGLILQPFWGMPLDRPLVRGAMVGFSERTTREHFYKAIIEGIAYELRVAKEYFESQLKHPFKAIRVSGGGSKSDEICQILADVFKVRIEKVQTSETSSLGAAIGGFLSIGEYSSAAEAVKNMVRVEKAFEPNMENAKIYDDLYKNAYVKLYPSLKNIYTYLYTYTAN